MSLFNTIAGKILRKIEGDTLERLDAMKGSRFFHGKPGQILIADKVHKFMCYGIEHTDRPVYFDIHGGGFAWGTALDGDLFCQELSERLKWQVFSLDYPLSTKQKYPGQLKFVDGTIKTMLDDQEHFTFDRSKVFIGGRSAGANLAAAVCLYETDQKQVDFSGLVLDHPWLDMARRTDESTRYAGPEALTKMVMVGLAYGYAKKKEQRTYLCSPLFADENRLRAMPPTIIQTCEKDSLAQEGELYFEKLRRLGIKAEYRKAAEAAHGFTESDTEIGEEGRRWIIEQLAKMEEKRS